MSYQDIFKKRHVLLPVIHVEGISQALRNVDIAKCEGADGVFLINHHISAQALMLCYAHIRGRYPDFWIGLNCLDLTPIEAFHAAPLDVSGIWVDNAGVRSEIGGTDRAAYIAKVHAEVKPHALYFGGVAFKYQGIDRDPALHARLAKPFVDVVTTSGDATGSAPTVAKIKSMKESVGDHPLAIASGITPENVLEYMPYADCFLVATGISQSHTELDSGKVRRLAKVLV